MPQERQQYGIRAMKISDITDIHLSYGVEIIGHETYIIMDYDDEVEIMRVIIIDWI
jgi:hypothetical protein